MKYSPDQIAKAKSLYLKYVPWHEISRLSEVPEHSIRKYATSSWRVERDSIKKGIIESALDNKRGVLISIAQYGLAIVEKGLKDILHSEVPLTAKELVNIASIVDSFDKIVKLDDGQATDRTEVIQPASIIEIKRMLNDPFMIEEAEIIKDEDSN